MPLETYWAYAESTDSPTGKRFWLTGCSKFFLDDCESMQRQSRNALVVLYRAWLEYDSGSQDSQRLTRVMPAMQSKEKFASFTL